MRRLLSIILLLSGITISYAADMRSIFMDMPESVLPLLSKNNRLDMLDFLDSGMKAVVRNKLEGESELLGIDETSLEIRYTGNSDIVMKLFYYRDSIPLICLVHTVRSRLLDSRLRFYDTDWNLLDGKRLLSEPSLEDFMVKGLSNDSVGLFRNVSSMNTVRISFPSEYNAVCFEYTGLSFMGQDSVRYSAFIRREPLVYEWNGRRFIMRKEK